MATFDIKHRATGALLFRAELSGEYDGASHNVRLGAAVNLALKARASLAGASLTGAALARQVADAVREACAEIMIPALRDMISRGYAANRVSATDTAAIVARVMEGK